jgi:hypothetical protein
MRMRRNNMWSSIPWSYWLGFALLLWLLFDLVRGETYIWQSYKRDTEVGMYWVTIVIWAIVAASCFVYPHWSFS